MHLLAVVEVPFYVWWAGFEGRAVILTGVPTGVFCSCYDGPSVVRWHRSLWPSLTLAIVQ